MRGSYAAFVSPSQSLQILIFSLEENILSRKVLSVSQTSLKPGQIHVEDGWNQNQFSK